MSETSNRVVDLACVDIGLCFIAEFPSGVTYTTQTGGTMCHHPRIQGVLVPLRCGAEGDLLKGDPLLNHFEFDLETEDQRVARVANWLAHMHLDHRFAPRGDTEVMEAWVPVVVRSGLDEYDPLCEFFGVKGVITYVNSD